MQKPITDPRLPVVADIKAISSENTIGLEWTPLNKEPEIAGYLIYRTQGEEKNFKEVGEIKSRYASHFVDEDLKINTSYTYKIITFTKENIRSNASNPVRVKTAPFLSRVSFFKAIGKIPHSIKLIWRPHTNKSVAYYEIFRRTNSNSNFKKIATVKNRLSAEYIDINLEDAKQYIYKIKAVNYDGVVGFYSQEQSAFTKKLPIPVTSIQATRLLPKKVKVSWDGDTNQDTHHYRLYESSKPDSGFKLIKRTKAKNSAILYKEDGLTRYYKVSVVDKDGLESTYSQVVVGGTLTKPKQVVLENAFFDDKTNKVILKWRAGDNRTAKYKVIKRINVSFLSANEQPYLNILDGEFVDTAIKKGYTYTYYIIAVDEFDIESKPLEAIKVEVSK